MMSMIEPCTNLPTLQQVLNRKTLPPLCLYNFYVIMRDRLHMEEVLDFYLDVQHHEQLWRRYVRSMIRAGHLMDDDILDGLYSPPILERLYHQDPFLRKDVIDSAQHILKQYLLPSAAKELTQLPLDLKNTIRSHVEQDHRDDPAVFMEAKDYLYELMQRQAYPKFLRVKVWGNVTLWQQLGRLVLSLVALLMAFTTGISLIFLGYPPWGLRCWIFLPFWIGVFNLWVFLTGLDPLWALLLSISETTTFSFNQIKHPQVKRILWYRSIWLLVTSLIVAVILSVVFCVVPSRRL